MPEVFRHGFIAEACSVYIVAPTDLRFPSKVGLAKDPCSRLAALQTAHHQPLMTSDEFWFASRAEARGVELEAHRRLKPKHSHGEWFNVRTTDAARAIVGILRERGYSGLSNYWYLDNEDEDLRLAIDKATGIEYGNMEIIR